MTPAVTFAAFGIAQKISGSSNFDITKAFTSLSLLSLLIDPVVELVMIPTYLNSAISCFDRIQEFLVQEKHHDPRTAPGTSHTEPNAFPTQTVLPPGAGSSALSSPRPLIRVQGANFGWKADSMILKNIDLLIIPSSLTIITGPVGSGKSTLLNSFLGETYMSAGVLEVSVDQIAFCDQNPWILNKPIRGNIIGFNLFREDFYNKVVRACDLEEDISVLPGGDDSVVGSDGIALSGGQKQRIVSIPSSVSA